uniref:MULE transposase domain-containing protein n=1 Tax=Lactuca sativa TaxID=4236 RepID=A0A9R1XVZ1_LACSA|nr:hypothetical protein LSAT_V11C100048290 [Lactuca sativa]
MNVVMLKTHQKCDYVRIMVVCASEPEKFQCPLVVRASWMSTKRSFQIKKMVKQHTYVRNFRSANLMDPTWIATHFLKEMVRKPNMKCKEMQAIIQSRFHCKVSWSKCCRAKVIGLDGSFLKGQCKGELLTAIRRDGNNHVYPIAWDVIETANKPNWNLLEATKVVLPHVEHIQCVINMYANFRKVFNGTTFKNMFWTVSKSTIEGDFKLNMENIREVNHAAYDSLMEKGA